MNVSVLIGKEYHRRAIQLFNSAKETVDVIIYRWDFSLERPNLATTAFTTALLACVLRGVRVRVLCGSPVLVSRLRGFGVSAKVCLPGKLTHAKLLIADSFTTLVGSHNFTQSAFTLNIEVSLAVQDASVASDLHGYFLRLWDQS